MPLKEGRCPNCGSILHLNGAAEKGHCLFCDAVFANREAFEIAENPSAYTFPNLPQPKYEGPSLDPNTTDKGLSSTHGGSVQKPKKKERPAPPPVYIPKEPVKLPDIRLPRKTKLRILLISLAVLLVIVAISLPLILQRDQARKQLLEAIPEMASFSVDTDKGVSIWYMANSFVTVAASEPVTQQEAIQFFKAYCEKRAAIAGLDLSDFNRVYGRVTVKLVFPDGGFLIDKPESMADLDGGSAIKPLA